MTTLQILHASDLEGGVDAIERAPNFAAIAEALESDTDNFDASIMLSAGDNYIPGPFFNAAGDRETFREGGVFNDFYNNFYDLPNSEIDDSYASLREGVGRVDISVMNAIGFDASAFGNHEFDLGTGTIEDIIAPDYRDAGLGDDRWVGAQFPYLSANLDFSQDGLSGLLTDELLPSTAFRSGPPESLANETIPKIAPNTIIERGGERIGVVGATTPLLASISSPGDVSVSPSGNDMAALAGVLQPAIDELAAEGINKIVLVTHLQQIALEEELLPQLSGVDVVIAGGSDTILADDTDSLRPGDEAAGDYPIVTENADGDPAVIVSSAGEYSYLGRLVVEFDENGIPIIDEGATDPAVSGIFATTDETVSELWGDADPFAEGTKAAAVRSLTEAVTGVVETKDSRVFGFTDVFLNGARESVRTQATNLGILTAEANLAIAKQYDSTVAISIKNGGGIRAPIGEVVNEGDTTVLQPPEGGEVSQLSIENALRFNNNLSLLTLTAEELLSVLEHAVAATGPGSTPGQFPQIAGLSFSFDATRPAIAFDDDGNVTQAGDRIRSVSLLDEAGNIVETLVVDGQLAVESDRTFRIVTLGFLAGGGDSYPFPFLAEDVVDLRELPLPEGASNAATFAENGSEQDALAEYLAANFATPAAAFNLEDLPAEDDILIQNLAVREDTVVSFESLMSLAGTYETGIFDESAAEINAYNPETQELFVVNGFDVALDVLDVSDPNDPTLARTIDLSELGAGVNSVAISNGVVAAAIEPEDVTANPGTVAFLDAAGGVLNSVEVGFLPDMVTFTPDGGKLLVANEGEPNDDYSIDPEGSIDVIDLAGGVENATVATADFTAFDDQIDGLREAGVRIFGPGATVAQDLEPEYIAVTADGSTAYVGLQENNAIAVVDVESATVTDILPLGFKDHSAIGLDFSDEDGAIDIATQDNLFGMYQPDAIATYEADGQTYLVTANEGDGREYDGFVEEVRVEDLTLDPEAFPDAETLQLPENLGRLTVTDTLGDTDGDGDFDELYAFGGRSFSIWQATETGLELVFDSGSELEAIAAAQFPDFFNSDNDENTFDTRSDNKGPEPEALAVGTVGDKTYAFVGLERIGGVMAYDITDPADAQFVQYLNNRNFGGDPEAGTAGDLGPEGITAIDNSRIAVSNEVSGSTTLIELDALNSAPTLEEGGTPSLEPVTTEGENLGTLVSDLVAGFGGDADGGAIGIAVVGTDTAGGVWEFSLNNGQTWTAFETPSNVRARLLSATARVRFVASATFAGTVSEGISFRAWDGSLGTGGGTANVTVNGSSTAFSSTVLTASVRVISADNNPPTVADLEKEIDEGTTIAFSLEDFTAAFEDEDGDELSAIAIASLPENGSLELDGVAVEVDREIPGDRIGDLTFTPDENFSGEVSFNYVAIDGQEASEAAAVNITVNSINSPPVVAEPIPDQVATTNFGFSLDVGENFEDPDEDELTYTGSGLPLGLEFDTETGLIIGVPVSAGTAAVTVAASDGEFSTEATFELVVNSFTVPEIPPLEGDGEGDPSVPGIDIEIPIRPPNAVENEVSGDGGDNDLPGSEVNDDVFGLGGNDSLTGLQGDDNLYGGLGFDLLFGRQGDDNLYGDDDGDTIFGGVGGLISGDTSGDADFIDGGNGDDVIFGNRGEDTAIGGNGDDEIYGGQEDDLLSGGNGDDFLAGDMGDDTIVGGNGRDRFLLMPDAGTDLIADFTDGTDLFILGNGLTFDQLAITEEEGTTVVKISDSDEVLATVPGVAVDDLSSEDFTLL